MKKSDTAMRRKEKRLLKKPFECEMLSVKKVAEVFLVCVGFALEGDV